MPQSVAAHNSPDQGCVTGMPPIASQPALIRGDGCDGSLPAPVTFLAHNRAPCCLMLRGEMAAPRHPPSRSQVSVEGPSLHTEQLLFPAVSAFSVHAVALATGALTLPGKARLVRRSRSSPSSLCQTKLGWRVPLRFASQPPLAWGDGFGGQERTGTDRSLWLEGSLRPAVPRPPRTRRAGRRDPPLDQSGYPQDRDLLWNPCEACHVAAGSRGICGREYLESRASGCEEGGTRDMIRPDSPPTCDDSRTCQAPGDRR